MASGHQAHLQFRSNAFVPSDIIHNDELGLDLALREQVAQCPFNPRGLIAHPPRLMAPLYRDAAGFHLLLQALLGQSVQLQRSTDLKAWENWSTVVGTEASQELVDPAPLAAPGQFYRALVNPIDQTREET